MTEKQDTYETNINAEIMQVTTSACRPIHN